MSIQNVEEEKAKKQYAQSGLAKIVPSITPEVEEKIEDPTGGVTPNYYSMYVKSLTPPITPEEEARRERAARAVQGIGQLGNMMTAFSNLTFTGKGAPSQTLATAQADKMTDDVTSWRDRLKSEREKYAAADLAGKAQQWKMEQEERRYADALKQQGIDNAIKLGNIEVSRAKLANDTEYQKQMLDLRVKELVQNGKKADQAFTQAMKELGLKERSIQLSEKEQQARKDGSYYSNSRNGGKAPTYLDVNGTTMRYNEDALTDAASMQAANILGVGDEASSPTQARMLVGAALNNKSPEMSEEDKRKIADVTEYLIGVGAINGEKRLGLNKKTINWDE